MKNIITAILIGLTINSFGQEKVTLDDGTKIIIYPNKTWKYESEVQQQITDLDSLFVNVKYNYLANMYKHQSVFSYKIKSFNKYEQVELIGYSNRFFNIKDSNGQIGYIPSYCIDVDNDTTEKFIQSFDRSAIKKAKSEGKLIYIRGAGVTERNSANGIDFSIDWGYFDSSKDIKYIYFTTVPYNKVGDVQTCRITGHSTFTGTITGPISAADKFNLSIWKTAWYNSTISCIKITKVKVEYMDGTSYIYVNELPKIIDAKYINSCN